MSQQDLVVGWLNDAYAMERSITQVLFPLGDEAIVHPGHGPDTTIGRERAGNPFVLEYLQAGPLGGRRGNS